MTRVCHVRVDAEAIRAAGSDYVYVGRGSPWGNPYTWRGRKGLSRYELTETDDPIGDYERHVRSRPSLMSRLPELRGKLLGCYCVRLGSRPLTKTAQIALAGNSVCPQVAEAVVAANVRGVAEWAGSLEEVASA